MSDIQLFMFCLYRTSQITVIQNLEQFSLDPKDFAHRLQIAVAASTTVGEGANAKAGLQVTVQGNQIKFLDKFLTGKLRSR